MQYLKENYESYLPLQFCIPQQTDLKISSLSRPFTPTTVHCTVIVMMCLHRPYQWNHPRCTYGPFLHISRLFSWGNCQPNAEKVTKSDHFCVQKALFDSDFRGKYVAHVTPLPQNEIFQGKSDIFLRKIFLFSDLEKTACIIISSFVTSKLL